MCGLQGVAVCWLALTAAAAAAAAAAVAAAGARGRLLLRGPSTGSPHPYRRGQARTGQHGVQHAVSAHRCSFVSFHCSFVECLDHELNALEFNGHWACRMRLKSVISRSI
mmetsp:Transcript_86664/g.225120  ORF Transcript_86664/g.225120 Transcript_86664/m.225120 type:complete len:110 (-) Transcript_86664:155-484(-)